MSGSEGHRVVGGDPPIGRGGVARTERSDVDGAKRGVSAASSGSREKGASLFTMIPLEPWNLEPHFCVWNFQETP